MTFCFPCMFRGQHDVTISCAAVSASVASSMQWLEDGCQGVRLHSVWLTFLLFLGSRSATLAFKNDLTPPPPIHLSHIQMLQYLVKANTSSISQGHSPSPGLYAFLSIQLTASSNIKIRKAVLGFSTDQ